jgi:hypothetical protein
MDSGFQGNEKKWFLPTFSKVATVWFCASQEEGKHRFPRHWKRSRLLKSPIVRPYPGCLVSAMRHLAIFIEMK